MMWFLYSCYATAICWSRCLNGERTSGRPAKLAVMQANGTSQESSPTPGVVELREDVPLKVGSSYGSDSSRCCGGGPRFILACFAALSAGITLALLTQIYYGDYEVVPHGSVSSSSANCSRAGTDALKAGGRAMDAAVTAALCLAVVTPHRTSLDASGSLLYWEYRTSHAQPPVLFEWGEVSINNTADRPPKMVAAFAALHAQLGVLPWSRVVQPAITIARSSSTSLNMSIADFLERFQYNSSSELASHWNSDKLVQHSTPIEYTAGNWKVYIGGAGSVVAGTALAATLMSPLPDPDAAFQRVVTALQQASLHGEWPPAGVASGLAVVDRLDTYVALTTGLSIPLGSGPVSPYGLIYDEPQAPLDLAPAIIVQQHVCGKRYIIGAESSGALAQAATALLTFDDTPLHPSLTPAVENPRVSVFANGVLAIEAEKAPPIALPTASTVVNATLPYPAVNVVMQKADAMMSTADSRGGGQSSRF
ncbi:gamma-glutamyltransferase 6-like isoform X1 [Phthorimaea operculella]|nr:gamma-glutamyltransferase 6-like isoform X1 [Phthorimaea operculella]